MNEDSDTERIDTANTRIISSELLNIALDKRPINVNNVLGLIKASNDLKIKNKDGQTSLMLASMNGLLEVVSKLFEIGGKKGIDIGINDADKDGNTALMMVCQYYPSKILTPHSTNSDNNMNRYSFIEGDCGVQIAAKLIEGGADINAKNKNNKTALMLAQDSDNKKIIDFLKQKGANDTHKSGDAIVTKRYNNTCLLS